MYPSHVLQLGDAIRARVGNFFVVVNICALSLVCTLYTPLLVNVVLSLQGSIFMHYMPHLTHVHSTFLFFVAGRSIQEQTQKKSNCNGIGCF